MNVPSAISPPSMVSGNKLEKGHKYSFVSPPYSGIIIMKFTEISPANFTREQVSSGEGKFIYSYRNILQEIATGMQKDEGMQYDFEDVKDKKITYHIYDKWVSTVAYFEDKGMAGGRRRSTCRRRSSRRRSTRY